MVTTARTPMPWLIIISGSLIAMLTFGPRSAMGFFQLPMLTDTGWDRSTFGLAMALQNLFWGMSQPFFGALADRYGTSRVLVASGVLYAAGLLLMAHANAPIWLHVGGGILPGGEGVERAAFVVGVLAGDLGGDPLPGAGVPPFQPIPGGLKAAGCSVLLAVPFADLFKCHHGAGSFQSSVQPWQ